MLLFHHISEDGVPLTPSNVANQESIELQSRLAAMESELHHHRDQLQLMEASKENIRYERDELRDEIARLRDALDAESVSDDKQLIQR